MFLRRLLLSGSFLLGPALAEAGVTTQGNFRVEYSG